MATIIIELFYTPFIYYSDKSNNNTIQFLRTADYQSDFSFPFSNANRSEISRNQLYGARGLCHPMSDTVARPWIILSVRKIITTESLKFKVCLSRIVYWSTQCWIWAECVQNVFKARQYSNLLLSLPPTAFRTSLRFLHPEYACPAVTVYDTIR